MSFFADLHIHSKYSRATSRNCDLENLAWWARRKGISVVATGDFTHPAWWQEISEKLVPAEPGLFRLRPEIEQEVSSRLPAACRGITRFLIEVEISTIYKKGDKTRKVHHLIYASNLETAGKFRDRLGSIGNISSDGRPILGLDSRDLLEITLESGPDAYLIPAHIWTPWFAAMGSKSGFDSIDECYGDLSSHIFAVETGLSSDPPMNWRVSQLDRFTLVSNSDAHSPPMLGREANIFETEMDYFAMRNALETGVGFGGTVEFFPEEGKYHLDGHRACQVCLEPGETRDRQGLCPHCGKPVTVGVLHRVETLSDRPAGVQPKKTSPFHSLVPLPEIVSEIRGVGPKSKTVQNAVALLVDRLGPELDILASLPIEDIQRATDPLVAEALTRLRAGQVHRQSGFDGEFGVIRLFEPGELDARNSVASLFESPQPSPSSSRSEAPKRDSNLPLDSPKESPSGPPSAALPTRRETGDSPDQVPPRSDPEPPTPVPPSPEAKQSEAPTSSSVLGALDPDQRKAAELTTGPMLIVAGPGTGKTRTLTHRLAYLVSECGVEPAHCLAVTFTRRAANEMRQRLLDLVPSKATELRLHTFHGLGLELIRENASALGFPSPPRVADPKKSLKILARRFELTPKEAISRAQELSQWRREHAIGQSGRLGQEGGTRPIENSEISDQAAAYEEALAASCRVDFDDLLILPLRLFFANPSLRSHYRNHFRHVAVDEFQDVDPLQYQLIRQLVRGGGNLCVIGDPDQSIYRFRGADVELFLRFQKDFPTTKRVQLGRNYRSGRYIVRAAVQAVAPSSLVPDRSLTAMRREAAERPVLHGAASDKAEAEFVVATIEKLLGGTSHFSVDSGRVGTNDGEALSFNDFAVLYRTDAQAAPLVEALNRSGIPFQKRSHHRLANQPAVAEILEVLPSLAEPGGASEVNLERLLGQAANVVASGSTPPLKSNLEAAVELLRPLALSCEGTVDDFLAGISLGAEVDTWDPRAERVTLMTLHGAKGLEFPVVFLVGCEEGLLPFYFPGEEPDLEEERRLFFVGITRAESRLFLSHAARRFRYGKVRPAEPSPFLRVIEEDLLQRSESRQKSSTRQPENPRQLRLL